MEKKIKRRGGGLCVLCGGEKQEKEKRNKEMKHGWKWNERKKNNIKIKNPNWKILPQYFHNKFK